MYTHSIKQKVSQQLSATPLLSTCLNKDSPLEEAVYCSHRLMPIPWDISTAPLYVILEFLDPSLKNIVFLLKEEQKCRILILVAHQLVKSSGERNRILGSTSNPTLYIFTLGNLFNWKKKRNCWFWAHEFCRFGLCLTSEGKSSIIQNNCCFWQCSENGWLSSDFTVPGQVV